MASNDHISDPESSEDDLLQIAPKTDSNRGTSQTESVLEHEFQGPPGRRTAAEDNMIIVAVPAPERPWEYHPLNESMTVDTILQDIPGPGREPWYKIEFEDGRAEDISLGNLLKLQNGKNALDFFDNGDDDVKRQYGTNRGSQDRSSLEPGMSSSTGKRTRTKTQMRGFVDISAAQITSEEDDEDDELLADRSIIKKRRLKKGRISLLTDRNTRQSSRASSRVNSRPPSRTFRDEDSFESDLAPISRRARPIRGGYETKAGTSGRTTRSSTARPIIKLNHRFSEAVRGDEPDELAGEGMESDGSDIAYFQRKGNSRSSHKRRSRSNSKGKGRRQLKSLSRRNTDTSSSSPERAEPTRRSARERTIKSMKERDMDVEIFADDVSESSNAPKIISIREVFQVIEKESPFSIFHDQNCDVCGGTGTNSNKGVSPLIYCQGCSSSIHKLCLGYRSTREAIVTKVGDNDFVMQCRRCVGLAVKKDSSAPRLDACQSCKEAGRSCAAFSAKKTTKQEEKLREDNDGVDPKTEVPKDLINSSINVLFRCRSCRRGYHFEHLPDPSDTPEIPHGVDELRNQRLQEYTPRWQCKECCEAPSKVQGLVAWRPTDSKSYVAGHTVNMFPEDEKEYLIKWENLSYFKCTWMPGAWVWGVTATVMRKAFFRRDEGANLLPRWTTEDSIPEEFLRMEIIFDVIYDDDFRAKSEASDKAHISQVNQVLVKFQGLGYNEAVWEDPPSPDDADRWIDFVAAYNEYVVGKYFKQPPPSMIKERIESFRSLNFEENVELGNQPSALTGGEIMPYQMEGLNWLLYNFHQKKNVILADEMGLGKTIQIIAMIAALVDHQPKCWPFLVVTPNSTCPNWRREIKKWAPKLRVVAYYGVKKARDMAMEYELFPDGCSDIRAHVVVTSYEAPVDDHSGSFFRRIKWAGIIVDEGQRLKNDENLLYRALKALKIPFQVLLTGTPLQNNKRELFNLLQFLDASMNASDLDQKYAELTNENLPELHDLIRPFFLRRTKIQVLKFLPPMAQVIIPVTMSLVQKKLYKSILAKNPDLIRSIFGSSKSVLRPTERGNLNNILMQLRKCLCHPFIYSSAIEETSVNETALHRNLVDASSKFQLLEIMLPKLRERGHRVLIFSQFLNQLDLIEDFLNGLSLPFQRLDGTIGSLEKQRRIDVFNAPDSPLFAFLLSTRAGGVGINLASADTVIIMDPDFNPHQDIQALSRAHRIGQMKKVLVFQLMTKNSAEEKIVQIGRKKMALDQALIESMGAEDDAGVDLESILKHGAEALFNEDDRNDIHYDSSSVDLLLDRTQVENTKADEEKTAESQFSYARVWANDKAALVDDDAVNSDSEPYAPKISVWDEILKQREADAALEAAKNMQTFGRGKRARQIVNYERSALEIDDETIGMSPHASRHKKLLEESHSDQDFAAVGESDGDDDSEGGGSGEVDLRELQTRNGNFKSTHANSGLQSTTKKADLDDRETHPAKNSQGSEGVIEERSKAGQWSSYSNSRSEISHRRQLSNPNSESIANAIPTIPHLPGSINLRREQAIGAVFPAAGNDRSAHQETQSQCKPEGITRNGSKSVGAATTNPAQQDIAIPGRYCHACQSVHIPGYCQLKLAGVEHCRLCNLAHFGTSRSCPNLRSEVQVRLMLDALARSPGPNEQVEAARKVLRNSLTQVWVRKKNRKAA